MGLGTVPLEVTHPRVVIKNNLRLDWFRRCCPNFNFLVFSSENCSALGHVSFIFCFDEVKRRKIQDSGHFKVVQRGVSVVFSFKKSVEIDFKKRLFTRNGQNQSSG
jgi:hypothetical protein